MTSSDLRFTWPPRLASSARRTVSALALLLCLGVLPVTTASADPTYGVMNANGEGFQAQQRQQQTPMDAEPMDGEGEQPEEAHYVQMQPAPPPPPPPVADEDHLPPFITGRTD